MSLQQFHEKALRREPLRVVFLGGSLTWGANASDPQQTSYRGRMMTWLREKYPATPFTFHDAAIGGTGSNLGMFRLQRDVLSHHPDLVLLDFTVNDGAEGTDIQNLASYERILRELLSSGSLVMPVLMVFKSHVNPDDPIPPRHLAHLKLAQAYGLPAANVLEFLRMRAKNGELNPDKIWNIGGDGAHPGDEGYQLIFEAVRDRYNAALTESLSPTLPEKTVFEDLYPRRHRHVLNEPALPDSWAAGKTYRTSLWYDGLPSRWMDAVAVASSKNHSRPLEMSFAGSMVAIFGQRNGFTPPIRVWIDGVPVAPPKAKAGEFIWKLDTSAYSPPKKGSGNLFLWQVLAKNLSDGQHQLRIEPLFTDSAPEAELHLESICSAGR